MLAEQKRDGEWRDWKQMAGQFSPVLASIELLDGLHLIPAEADRRALLASAVAELGGAKDYYRHVVVGMLGQRRETYRVAELEACYRSWAAASVTQVRAAEGLGAAFATRLCTPFIGTHREFANALGSAIGDHTRGLDVEDLDEARNSIDAVHRQARQVDEIFQGYMMQLDWKAENPTALIEPDPDRIERHDGIIVYDVGDANLR